MYRAYIYIAVCSLSLLLCEPDSFAGRKIIESRGDQSPAINIESGGTSNITYQTPATVLDGTLKPISSLSSDSIRIYLGNNTLTLPRSALLKGEPINVLDKIFHIDGTMHEISVKLRENKLLLSTTVYTLDRKIVATIRDNEWAVNQYNHFRRNYDESSIEILDPFLGVPALQVMLLDNDSFRICGVFVSGSSLMIVHDRGFAIESLHPDLDLGKVMATNKIAITPIFTMAGERSEYGAKLLNDYKRRLSLRTTNLRKHTLLDNRQLALSASVFAQELKEFARSEENSRKSQWRASLNVGPEAAAKAYDTLGREREVGSLKRYEAEFQMEACSLRNEIIRRLNLPVNSRAFSIYEDLDATTPIENIADSMRALALYLSLQTSKFKEALVAVLRSQRTARVGLSGMKKVTIDPQRSMRKGRRFGHKGR